MIHRRPPAHIMGGDADYCPTISIPPTPSPSISYAMALKSNLYSNSAPRRYKAFPAFATESYSIPAMQTWTVLAPEPAVTPIMQHTSSQRVSVQAHPVVSMQTYNAPSPVDPVIDLLSSSGILAPPGGKGPMPPPPPMYSPNFVQGNQSPPLPTTSPQLLSKPCGIQVLPPRPCQWQDLASQVAERLNQGHLQRESSEKLKIKNTFIHDGSLTSPFPGHASLRQIRSCPGSRLPSPRGKDIHTLYEVDQGDLPVSSSASTVDTTDYTDAPVGENGPLDSGHWGNDLPHTNADRSGAHHAYRLQLERAVASQPQVLELERVLSFDSQDVPSLGSLGHNNRRCKPCAFVTRQGCSNGMHCKFCHLCGPGEKKKRRKEKRALLGAAKQLAVA